MAIYNRQQKFIKIFLPSFVIVIRTIFAVENVLVFLHLLTDVAPWALMTNQTSMPLALLDGNGDQWMIGVGQTIAPPSLEDQEFQIGLHHMAQMHYSGKIWIMETSGTFLVRCLLNCTHLFL